MIYCLMLLYSKFVFSKLQYMDISNSTYISIFVLLYLVPILAVQLLLCFLTRKIRSKIVRIVIRLIPLIILFLDFVLLIMISAEIPEVLKILDISSSGFEILFMQFDYTLAMLGEAAGMLIAWGIYGLYCLILKRQKLRREAVKYENPIGEINNRN